MPSQQHLSGRQRGRRRRKRGRRKQRRRRWRRKQQRRDGREPRQDDCRVDYRHRPRRARPRPPHTSRRVRRRSADERAKLHLRCAAAAPRRGGFAVRALHEPRRPAGGRRTLVLECCVTTEQRGRRRDHLTNAGQPSAFFNSSGLPARIVSTTAAATTAAFQPHARRC